MSSYSEYHKNYYQQHKEEISFKLKDKQYWKKYYEKNKEIIKEKALQRYYNKKNNTI
jgi:hypothetical protein